MRYEVRVNGGTVSRHGRREDALNDACVQLQRNLGSPVEVVDGETGRPCDEDEMKRWCTEHPPN